MGSFAALSPVSMLSGQRGSCSLCGIDAGKKELVGALGRHALSTFAQAPRKYDW